MTIHLPDDLANAIRTAVLNGSFGSEDELVAAAVRDYLHRNEAQARPKGESDAGTDTGPEEESTNQALQRRLFEAGVLSEIKPPITDFTLYRERHAVLVQGEPISETIIRERR